MLLNYECKYFSVSPTSWLLSPIFGIRPFLSILFTFSSVVTWYKYVILHLPFFLLFRCNMWNWMQTKNAVANAVAFISHSTTVAYKLFFFDMVQECHFCILASICPVLLFFVFAQVFAQTHLTYRFLLFFHTVPESSRFLRA